MESGRGRGEEEEAQRIFLRCLGLGQVTTGAVGKEKVVKTSKEKGPLDSWKGKTEVKSDFGGICR